MRRSLTLISEGMLSRSTKKALTIASIGWLVADVKLKEENGRYYIEEGGGWRYKENENEKWNKIIAEEDEIIIALLKEAVKIINF